MTETPAVEATKAKHETDETDRSKKKMRALHVPIPEATYWHLRQMALQSRMAFKIYMARFLEEAWAFPPTAEATEETPSKTDPQLRTENK